MILLIWCGVVGWLLLFGLIDRNSRPAWQVRNAYRVVSVVLLLLLLLSAHKSLMYREELRTMIRICR